MSDHRIIIIRCGEPSRKSAPWLCEFLIGQGLCPDKDCEGRL